MLFNPYFLLPFGVIVGIFSGLLGIGGGAVIIPILVLVFHVDQQTAHGTSLGMILSPTALPAILKYHSLGKISWPLVLWVAPGMIVGSYIGATIANSISTGQLKLVFGFILIYTAGYTIFGKDSPLRGVIMAGILVAFAVALWFGLKWYDNAGATTVA
jgi:uncharacterized membrane protein YfcA